MVHLLVATPDAVRAACRGWQEAFPADRDGVTEEKNPFTGAPVGWGLRSPVPHDAVEAPGLLERFPTHFIDLESPAVEGLLKTIGSALTDLSEDELSELHRPHLVGPRASTEVIVKIPDRLVRALVASTEARLVETLATEPDLVEIALEVAGVCRPAASGESAAYLVVDYS